MLLNHPEVPINAERMIASVDISGEEFCGELDAGREVWRHVLRES
jgi:hypothetical protein